MIPLILFAAFILINIVTILRFWADKERAKNARRRISEADLLALALIGGTPGAYLARAMFHHKTRKQPFSRHLAIIAVLQVAVLAGLMIGTLVL